VKNREVMGAGGYEIFRNIVDCAHLKPLDQGEGVTFMENQTNKIGAARISFRELQYRNSAAASLPTTCMHMAHAKDGERANATVEPVEPVEIVEGDIADGLDLARDPNA
jgi:hypothetical protein